MKRLAITLALVAAMPLVAAVTYPTITGTFTAVQEASDTITSNNAVIVTSPDNHQWIDADSGTPGPSKFYGGKLSWTPSPNEWGSSARFALCIGNQQIVYLRAGEGQTYWSFNGDVSSTNLVDYPRATNFTFIIKLEDLAWNVAVAKLFLDAQTKQLVEPTSDYGQVSVINRTTLPFDRMAVQTTHASWDGGGPSTLTISDAYSNYTNWPGTPEPAVALVFAAVAFAFRRK